MESVTSFELTPLNGFYSASAVGNAGRCNSRADMSVCPSRSGVLSRRMKIRSCGLQLQVGKSF